MLLELEVDSTIISIMVSVILIFNRDRHKNKKKIKKILFSLNKNILATFNFIFHHLSMYSKKNLHTWFVCKIIGKFINNRDQNLLITIFLWKFFVGKIITHEIV